ncbi:MAG TPA: hypothetical protein PKD99_12440 [Sphingopyxis sp.]|nr:hypothetical protein [Sphingopyxis sp.]HMP45907.1 hypothetical protein [Sphingopyxis sp.]
MTFVLPLETRVARAEDNRRRYWSNPAERLKRINKTRARRGLPPRDSLDGLA